MHADERLSAMGHASGSAEVAAQALSAVRRALNGLELKPTQRNALKEQADLIDWLGTASERADNPASLASMLAQEGHSFRDLTSFQQRVSRDESALRDARDFLRWLAAEPHGPADIDAERAKRVMALCREWLSAALDLLGSAAREQEFPSD
jgi:hypothetical protein